MELVQSEKMVSFLAGIHPPQNETQIQAFEHLTQLEFPTTRDEYWKYTRLGKISNASFTNKFNIQTALEISDYIVSDNYLIIENGIVRHEISAINSGFEVSCQKPEEFSSFHSFRKDDVFHTLNTALFFEAIVIKIAEKKEIAAPLQLIFVNHSEQIISNNRVQIVAGKFSNANITITNISLDGATNNLNNTILDIKVEENAHLTIDKIQAENDTCLSMSTEEVTQYQNSTFKINTISLGGLLIRNNINIAVAGENCESYMNGAVITKDNQHIDNHTYVNHMVPNCYSNENYKYVLDDKSTGVFNGKVIVQKDAQVINAYQNNGNILLSQEAKIFSKPELEIYADDVKCSHGSTTGQLDEDALYYLQTRGISRSNAKKMLVSAFVGEVIDAIKNEKATTLVRKLLTKEYGWTF